jgi:hypothetical protein
MNIYDLIKRRYPDMKELHPCEDCEEVAEFVYRSEDKSLRGITLGSTKWLCEKCMSEYVIQHIRDGRITYE